MAQAGTLDVGRYMFMVSVSTSHLYDPSCIRCPCCRGSTALHYAALADNVEIMAQLIKAGADPLIRNAQGYKPMQFATRSKHEMFHVCAWSRYFAAEQILNIYSFYNLV